MNNTVFALSVLGTTVYAGGAFTAANGAVGRNHVAAFSTTGNGTAIPSWNPNANGFVYALDAWNNTVFLGGDFTSIGPLPRGRLASVSAPGALQTWNPGANNTVYTLAHANGTEYAGGAFTTVNSNVARGAAAAFDPATGAATSWNPRLVLDSGNPAIVIALAPTVSTMYLGGFFDRQNTGSCAPNCFFSPNLAAISLTDGNALTTWQPAPNGAVNAIAVAPQAVVVGGAYSALGYPPSGAAYAADEPAATYRGGLAVLPGLPDAPTVTATPGDSSATVTVQLPAFVGGGSVVGYTVTTFPGNVTVSSPTSPITVTGLTNGTGYSFSTTVTTTVGTGAAGVSSFVVPRTVPGAPPSVTAVPADISAVVSFTAPASDGGDPITEYTVTSSPDGKTASGTSSPIEVRGLHNGTSYTFTVTATNSAGTGPASAPSAPVVPAEGGRPHTPAPEGLPRPDVPPVPPITNPRVPPPHQG